MWSQGVRKLPGALPWFDTSLCPSASSSRRRRHVESQSPEVWAMMAKGLAARRVGVTSGRQLVRDKMLPWQHEGTKPNSYIFTQVEDLGREWSALCKWTSIDSYLLYLSRETVLFPPLQMSSSSVDKTWVLFIILHSFLAIMPAWATEIPYQLTLSLHRPPPPPGSTPMDQSPVILPKLRLGWPAGSHIIYMWTQTLKNKTTGRPRSASLADRRSALLGAGVGPGCLVPKLSRPSRSCWEVHPETKGTLGSGEAS